MKKLYGLLCGVLLLGHVQAASDTPYSTREAMRTLQRGGIPQSSLFAKHAPFTRFTSTMLTADDVALRRAVKEIRAKRFRDDSEQFNVLRRENAARARRAGHLNSPPTFTMELETEVARRGRVRRLAEQQNQRIREQHPQKKNRVLLQDELEIQREQFLQSAFEFVSPWAIAATVFGGIVGAYKIFNSDSCL